MKCPYCENQLPPDAVHCPHCGAPTGAAPQEDGSKAAMSDEIAAELQKLKKERKKLKQLREELEEEAEYDEDDEDDEDDDDEEEPSQLGQLAHTAGWVLIVIGIADFAGMFLGYDFTGSPWTPLLFGGVGEILINLDI